jgi:hypothetical protein
MNLKNKITLISDKILKIIGIRPKYLCDWCGSKMNPYVYGSNCVYITNRRWVTCYNSYLRCVSWFCDHNINSYECPNNCIEIYGEFCNKIFKEICRKYNINNYEVIISDDLKDIWVDNGKTEVNIPYFNFKNLTKQQIVNKVKIYLTFS